MVDGPELLKIWHFPITLRHGLTLVARQDAIACVQRIVSGQCRFYGYDAFTVFTDNNIQPHMEFSCSWEQSNPSLDTLLATLHSHPANITHYEFVFESAV